jgi:hypothetical protein
MLLQLLTARWVALKVPIDRQNVFEKREEDRKNKNKLL